jgi:hypothetical protein
MLDSWTIIYLICGITTGIMSILRLYIPILIISKESKDPILQNIYECRIFCGVIFATIIASLFPIFLLVCLHDKYSKDFIRGFAKI